MKSHTRPRKPKSTPQRASLARLKENDKWLMLEDVCELAQIAPLVRNSYVLSRFWAWFSRIEVSPTVKVPVPRFLTYRDP